ncbi:MAG: tetratricopeptide repeat protein [Gemmatimonadetes bacterium]|nr:tetratricopeptide repeat protein [Gemmatimonadota bacterium]
MKAQLPGWKGLAAAGALALVAVAAVALGRRPDPAPAPGVALTPFPAPAFAASRAGDEVAPADFVGAAACASCHAEQHRAWSLSTHGRAGGPAGPDVLIAPFDGRPVRFQDGEVIPRRADGRYEFVVRQHGQAEQVLPVDGVVGGGHMLGGGTQGFLTRWADGTLRFLPFDWSRQEGAWFCNTGTRLDRGWVPVNDSMALRDCGDWPPLRVMGSETRFANCQECHGSQIQVALEPGAGYRTDVATLQVNCESCHGPARRHVDLAASGGFGADGDIALAPLGDLDKDASLGVCFQCHALKDVLEPGYLPGDPLEEHFALKFPILGDEPYFPDGRVRTFAYQGTHLYSACYLEGPMDCVSCHEPHGQGYWDVRRRPLDGPFDDGQCTACHASKAVDPQEHTFHPPGSEGSRCVACHMPYLQHPEVGPGVRFARSDHTIPVPRPAFDAALGVESACARCHADRGADELQALAEAWWGELKPHRPLVAALLEEGVPGDVDAAAERLLRPREVDPMPQFHALGRFLLERLEPDAGELPASARERLLGLARSDDLDVRALALVALHWSRGDDAEVRTLLVRTLEAAGTREEALRRRWGMALGFLADLHRDRGDFARSRAGYRKALEILPGDPRILAAVGVMYNQAGEPANAAVALRRSLEGDPRPLTWINLGIALGAQGDAAGAAQAYRRALALDPHEPLAHYNLGNLHLRAGEQAAALGAYREAVAADPGLGRAHLHIARILGEAGQYAEALPHARRAVEFEPDHAPSREVLGALERLVDEGR